MSVQIGDVIAGKYALRESIAEGGMGIVFLAHDRALARTVAIKVLHPRFAGNEAVTRRFLAEAVAASRVRHPSSVAMLDCNFLRDGTPYLVMEHVPGRPLASLVAEQAIALPRVLAIMDQLLGALAAIHNSGVIHADVTSDNVLVDDRDRVRLIDFGSARLTCNEHAAECIAAVPDYLAPEIARRGVPTASGDIYAAGVILYQLVTGTLPFHGRGPRYLDELVVPPSRRRPERAIGSALDGIVLTALAKSPVARFPDAHAFAFALRELAPRTRMARGTGEIEIELRRAISDALVAGDVVRIADGYSRLARELLRVRRVREAIRELREGIDVVTRGSGPAAADAPAAVIPLVTALAALRADDERTRHIATSGDGMPKHTTGAHDPQHRGMREAL